jgi:hypothetical protein
LAVKLACTHLPGSFLPLEELDLPPVLPTNSSVVHQPADVSATEDEGVEELAAASAIMAYEAAMAVALRDQSQPRSREVKGSTRSRRQQQVEEKVVTRCGVLIRILRRVLPLPVAPAPSSQKK